ncbi:MAG: 2-oxo acid dehydrogenase subunit E2 [Bauldia sp.]
MSTRWRSIPPLRRLIIDFMHFSVRVPAVVAERRMRLAPLSATRGQASERISWLAIFAKAYVIVVDEFVELRRAYVTLPWPHFCEFAEAEGFVTIEREADGERAALNLPLRRGPGLGLAKLDGTIRYARNAPLGEVPYFRRLLLVARLPRPLRRLAIWLGLNWGRQRSKYFGSFLITSYAALGAEALRPLSPATSTLTYGTIDEEGSVTVRITYDHRVVDGAIMARVLVRLEEVLNGVVADELRGLQPRSA